MLIGHFLAPVASTARKLRSRLTLGQILLVRGASGGVSTALIRTGRPAGFEILNFYPLAARHLRGRQRDVSSLSRFSQCDVSICPDYRNGHQHYFGRLTDG